MSVSIRSLTPSDAAAWDGFVTAHPDGTFFHLSAWERVIARAIRKEEVRLEKRARIRERRKKR